MCFIRKCLLWRNYNLCWLRTQLPLPHDYQVSLSNMRKQGLCHSHPVHKSRPCAIRNGFYIIFLYRRIFLYSFLKRNHYGNCKEASICLMALVYPTVTESEHMIKKWKTNGSMNPSLMMIPAQQAGNGPSWLQKPADMPIAWLRKENLCPPSLCVMSEAWFILCCTNTV